MLANYSELQQEIADTLQRDDLAAKIPSFIKLFENRVNRLLRTSEQEITTPLSLLSGNNAVSIPDNFLEPINVTINISGNPCQLIMLNSIDFDQVNNVTSVPIYYTIRNRQLIVDCIADQNYTINLHYLKRWDLATDVTNWLLTYNPDAYLYGSLAAGSVYIMDDSRLPTWSQLAAGAIDEINDVSYRTRNKSPLRTDIATLNRNQYNINIDY